MKRRTPRKTIARMLLGLVSAAVLWSAGLAWRINAYGRRHDPAPADVAIVLGAAVRDTVPSPVFAARIDHAVDLYRRGRVRRIVFTGGVGAGDRLAESEAARRYALRAGVPDERIAIETRSTITYENLVEARALLAATPPARVLIVSDPLHMRRAVTMARDLGLDAHPAPTPTTRYRSWRSKAPFLAREVWFHSLYLIRRLFL
ncbi:YdcF family protein [Longimicrobium sp.]|uniref:YdcF family protein n=1 Tax=Longimicrobium sp. TaxID=2029185 RepID=UPI002E37B561|nr:YdcF family protein [Longimicrobium sp.]HEX6036712.1 YdcF family protein [Longimicrobium sp.]